MTDQLTFDRLLAAALSDGPDRATSRVVDAAVNATAVMPQRRARFDRLDAQSWPPPARSIADPRVRRDLRLLLVASVVLATITATAVVGYRLIEQQPTRFRPTTLTSAGTLPNWVRDPIAVPLADGRVLVAGSELRAIAQVLDPAAGTSFLVDDRGIARTVQWAVALPDGRVVLHTWDDVADVADSRSLLWTFDPETNSTGDPVETLERRFRSAGAAMPDGRVLIAGGERDPEGAPALSSTEIFDPTSGTLVEGPALPAARFGHSAYGLPDGRVLMFGGYRSGPTGPINSIETFDPATGDVSELGVWDGDGHRPAPVRLPDGRILLIDSGVNLGGCGRHGIDPVAARVLDAASGLITQVGALPHSVLTAAALPDGRVVVTGSWQAIPGGCASGGEYVMDQWLGVYDPATGLTIESRNPITGEGTLGIDTELGYDAGVLLADGRVLLIAEAPRAGGTNQMHILAVAPR